MPLDPISFADLQNAPSITPGVGGWDVILNTFMSEQRAGRTGFGLLARAPNIVVVNTPGITLLTAPAGWFVMPWLIGIRAITTSSWENSDIIVEVGSSSPLTWAYTTQLDTLNTAGYPMVVVGPRPQTTGLDLGFGTDSPQSMPILDGDTADRETLRVRASQSGPHPSADYFVWGAAWPQAD
jgi:hypothetical protein